MLPEAPIYNLATALHLEGEIDPYHFSRAFRVLVNSSDALRTIIEENDGIPMQRVLPQAAAFMDFLDFSQHAEAEIQARIWIARHCETPIHWLQVLYHSALIKIGSKHFVWYLNVHHIICDGWSFELIYRQMSELYRASFEGRLPARANLPAFADYRAYERDYRRSSRHQKAEAYWNEVLARGGNIVNFYGKLPLGMTTKVCRISHELGPERTDKLKAVAAAITGGTASSDLFDAFAAVLVGYLYCLNGSETYTIGVPFHNRRSQSSKETIGFFSEVLPVQVALAEDESFASLSKKFSAELRKTLRYGQHSVTNPIFKRLYEVTLNFHTSSFSEFAGISARPEWIHNGHGDESLGVQIRDFGSSNSLAVDFDLHEGIFDVNDGHRVVNHFLRVLDTFLLDPSQPVRRLSLTSPQEMQRLIAEWHPPVKEKMSSFCVQRLIEEQALKQPDATAVIQGGSRVTYGELNCRANAVAQLMRERGAKTKMPIGVYLTRSSEMIIAMLAVLKTGAPYVPIDPQYSTEWLKFILEDTGATMLLTQRSLLGSLPEIGAEALCLDDPENLDGSNDENLGIAVEDDDLAYIIYTSGSTGTPKGVEISHGALANFTAEAATIFELTPSDRVLQFASVSFDTSVEEIFPCLTRGASLVLRTDSTVDSTSAFLELCRDLGVTVLDLPTAYWHELATTLFRERHTLPSSVRLVIIGGERAIIEKVALWQVCVDGSVRLLNTYGPTEAAVVSTVYDLTHAALECGVAAEVPIGRAIGNVQTLVLDQNLSPVTEGVPGELYIGGVGLARGYVRRPELTAERFIPNPFDVGSASRLYKTGDIVRHREDGNLEFLRRSDEQIKVRGFRVELEGIESVIRQHPLIRDAAVLHDAASRSGRLVAYVVAQESAVLNLADVQKFVRRRLPEYMLPSALVQLDLLPLTPRGKVDRRALSHSQDAKSETQDDFIPPQSATEERIAGIWRDLLSLSRIGRDQHFFELGGHSLLAAQAISRVRREWQVEIPLRAIFEAPTVASLAERIEQVLQQGNSPAEATPVAIDSYNGHAPASDSQSRIWYMDQFAPESTAYNITTAIRFIGSLDRRAFRESVDQLVARHQSLRTTVRNVDGQPVQAISSILRLELPEIDLTTAPNTMRIDEAKRILQEEGRRPFNLSTGPLLRLLLLRLNDDDHVLLLTMHHLISDQWSLNVIAREISSLYNASRKGAAPTLEPPQAQYGDFAVWQNHYLSPDRLQAGLSYWKNQLAGVEASIFPSDRPRPPTQTFRGAHQSFSLPTDLVEKLRKLAIKENATLYMVFLAIFKILLARYSGREDVAIGSPVTNRTRSEWEGIIGTFINILVLRSDLSGNPSLRQIIRRVRETVLDGFTHQEVPFQKIVEELVPGRDSSRTPLVQALFNFQSTPVGNANFDGMSWMPFEIDQWAAQFDVNVTIDPEVTRKIFVSYNTDLYDAETIHRIIGHYRRLLDAATQDAEQSLSSLSLSMVEEPKRRAAGEEDLKLSIPESCVHDLFEAQACQTPDAVAVVYEEQYLTYSELNERSNQLARRLRGLGAGPGRLVGIVIERSPELVIGILAVLKTGAAYVPVDPGYPPDRIAFICQDSCMAALVTQKSWLATLPKRLPNVCLDETIGCTESTENVELLHDPNELAYVIYTSGSTGNPKGVEISHRALVNFLYSMRRKPGFSSADILLSVTTISFDIAALELFLPLIVGARVVIASREVVADAKRLITQLAACGATVMQATPTTWRMMLDAGWEGVRGLRIICGGEPLPMGLAQALVCGNNSVWNLYGPTETTVWSSIWPVEPNCQRISIGYPIQNTQINVLDPRGLPVPVGVVGELYIGGEGLARGYLNRPELTAEKFVPNPFGAPSSRLYRTGDLGRYLADGNIEFVGRIDNQVKVRGFRIELGEVEVVLCGQDAVSEAVVVVREEGTDKSLVAYVVTREGRSVTEKELIGYAKQKLPNYMIPSAFVFLESLPLTPNGKINRRALPVPEGGLRDAADFLAPRTAIEVIIESIWQQVLKRTEISIHENFFNLGGHSLLATQMIAHLRDAFGRDIPLRAVFEAPTIAELSVFLESELRDDECRRPPPITTNGDKKLTVSFAQERLWFLNQLQPNHPVYNISLVVRVSGPLDVAAMERSLGAIVARHQILRTAFPTVDGHPEPAVAAPGPVSISVVNLMSTPEADRMEQARGFALEFIRQPFDLERGPLFHLALLRLDAADHVLVFVVHHILFDARSAEIFLEELIKGYEKADKNEPFQLPEPQLQYADYAAWQRATLQGEYRDRQLRYWAGQLEGSPPLLKLSTDRPRPPLKSYRGACYSWTIAAPTVAAIKRLGRSEHVTPFMTMVAAFNVLLHRYSGQDDIVIGTPISNRTAVETETMIGPFINTLALRTDLSGDPSFRDLLRRVRETALAAYTHQDLPFEQLLRHLRLERDVAHTPLFQVMFVFQNTPAMEIPKLAIQPISLDGGTAKFDLTLTMTEIGDQIHTVFEYDTDLFDHGTIERMAAHFQTLLQSIITNLDQCASELALLNDVDRRQVLNQWSVGQCDSAEPPCLHRLFEAQAASTPDAIAVECGNETWTYRELNARANLLARRLSKLGIGPEALVGICLDRSPELMAALLAVLKAGGAYVPLDPNLPQERLEFMRREAGCTALITQSQLRDYFARDEAVVLCLDGAAEISASESVENVDVTVMPDNSAYVIYTSGSTGLPKGIVLPHRALVNYLTWAVRTYAVDQGEGAPVFSSISFDLTVTALFAPLLTGKKVELLREDSDWQALAHKLTQSRNLSFVKMTPSHLELLSRQTSQEEAGRCAGLFIIGGENLTADHVRFWRGAAPHVTIINEYGPTETAVGCCMYQIPDANHIAGSIPIGRPIANTQVYILDSRLEPLPVGVVGELYIGGEGLARGYLNRPELTAEKFVPNPFGSLSSRLYRTGDLGRYLADGNIEFIGRIDNQVKVRGFRIELGEVEVVLCGQEAVSEAVVVVREEGADKRLVAYVVTREGGSVTEKELIGYAKQKLPNYMIPSAFVFLESLPLTPNGKINRRALPAPEGGGTGIITGLCRTGWTLS